MLGVISGFFLLVPKCDCHLLKSILNQKFEINIVLKYGIFFYWTNIMVSVQHTVSWLENHQDLCVTYDITGNDVHFVLDIKTVHLHRPFPCVSPQNFIAFCIDFLVCSSIGTNQNNWVSMVLRKLRFELHVQLSIFE